MPCHVPTCPTRPGPSGFCRFHQNRLNARASAYAEYMTDADRVAIAAHPGWRGRPWQLNAIMWADGLHFHASPEHGIGPGYKTAAEALAEVDRRNGLLPAADVARLEADLDVDRRDNRDMWCALDAIQGITVGRFPPPATSTNEITIGSVAVDKVTALKRRLDEVEAGATKLTAERNAALRALSDIRVFAHGLLPVPPRSSTPPATLGESALAAVAILIRDRDEIRRDRDTLAGELAAAREALDRQAADIARLTSELAERERDVTDLCAERDGYAADLEAARRTALADADTIDNLRTGVGHLETALTLARRPWWRKVWAWVTGGAE